jgi:hypothetical protein
MTDSSPTSNQPRWLGSPNETLTVLTEPSIVERDPPPDAKPRNSAATAEAVKPTPQAYMERNNVAAAEAAARPTPLALIESNSESVTL